MKSKLILVASFFLLMTAFSCKKAFENNELAGKWKPIEVYAGYLNSGNFKWVEVPSENSHTLYFIADGSYQKTESESSNNLVCTGTYSLHADTLHINTGFNTVSEKQL